MLEGYHRGRSDQPFRRRRPESESRLSGETYGLQQGTTEAPTLGAYGAIFGLGRARRADAIISVLGPCRRISFQDPHLSVSGRAFARSYST